MAGLSSLQWSLHKLNPTGAIAPQVHGRYNKRDTHNLARFISIAKARGGGASFFAPRNVRSHRLSSSSARWCGG